MSELPDAGSAAAGPPARRLDEEDAAAVIAVLTALAAAAGEPETEPVARSVWGNPADRLGLTPVSPVGWWASGLAR